jgi:hypothetical protein
MEGGFFLLPFLTNNKMIQEQGLQDDNTIVKTGKATKPVKASKTNEEISLSDDDLGELDTKEAMAKLEGELQEQSAPPKEDKNANIDREAIIEKLLGKYESLEARLLSQEAENKKLKAQLAANSGSLIEASKDAYREANDDLLDEEKRYFSYRHRNVITGYRIGSKEIIAPTFDKKIEFVPLVRYHKKNTGKTVCISRFSTKSKAIAEFIENSPLFNISIFNSVGQVKNVDTTMADAYSRAAQSIASKSDSWVIDFVRRAKEPVSEDINSMRRKAVSIMAKLDVDKSIEITRDALERSQQAKNLLENKD